jgi:hypothetical protein
VRFELNIIFVSIIFLSNFSYSSIFVLKFNLKELLDCEMAENELFGYLNFLFTIFGLNDGDNCCKNFVKWITRIATISYQFYCLIFGLFDLTSNPSEMYYYLALEFKSIIASITYLIILKRRKEIFNFQVILFD